MSDASGAGAHEGRAAVNFRFGPDIPFRLWRSLQELPTPAGEPCSWCGEPVALGDSGVVIPHMGRTGGPCDAEGWGGRMRPAHWACHLRSVLGGVAHQLGLCTCCGGDRATAEAAAAGLTARQEALAAFHLHAALHCRDSEALAGLAGLCRLLPPPEPSAEALEALQERIRQAARAGGLGVFLFTA